MKLSTGDEYSRQINSKTKHNDELKFSIKIQSSDVCLLMEGSKNSGPQVLTFLFIHVTLGFSVLSVFSVVRESPFSFIKIPFLSIH